LGFKVLNLRPGITHDFDLGDFKGPVVAQVAKDGPASDALEIGDGIVAVNGERVNSASDLAQKVSVMAPGSKVALTVEHGTRQRVITVTLDKPPAGNTSP
jgi:S1-C subfamily serine protease